MTKAYEKHHAKTSRTVFRLDPEDRERLENLAAKAGMSNVDLLRYWISQGKIPDNASAED